MADIFLSYARDNHDTVEPLVKTLEDAGWTVFWDRRLRPGSRYRTIIDEQLSSASCVLVIWSRESVKSRWVLDEADAAAEREILIPIRIDDTPIPLGFGQFETLLALPGVDSLLPERELAALFEGIGEVLRFSRSTKARQEELLRDLGQRVLGVLAATRSQTTAELARLLEEPRTRVFRVCSRLKNEGRITSFEVRGRVLHFWPVTREIVTKGNYDRINEELGSLREIVERYSLHDPMLSKELNQAFLQMGSSIEMGSPPGATIIQSEETVRGLLDRMTKKSQLLDFLGLRKFEVRQRSWQLAHR
jgi:hypothetical protein